MKWFVATQRWVGGGYAKFWVDPRERLVACFAFPVMAPGDNALLRHFERLVFAAMIDRTAIRRATGTAVPGHSRNRCLPIENRLDLDLDLADFAGAPHSGGGSPLGPQT